MSARSLHSVLALAAGALLVAPLTQVAGADQPSGQRAPAVGEIGYALIQGKVADHGTGKAIDGVTVTAVRHKEVKGISGASDLTYASPDNAIKHGYFAMHVPHGTYTVTFSKKDYAPVERRVERKQEQRAGIGEVLLQALPRTKIVSTPRQFRRDDRRPMVLRVKLISDVRQKPTGTVSVLVRDQEIASGPVKGSQLEIVLPQLEEGRHGLRLVYSGDERHHSAEVTAPVAVLPPRG